MDYHFNHVSIFFLPGAAGNFLGRCLNLLDDANCFVDSELLTFPKTLEEKVQLVSYHNVTNRTSTDTVWYDFERKLSLFYCVDHWYDQIEHKKYVIQIRHPDGNEDHNIVRSQNDRNFVIYIDPTDAYEWHFLNCLYKNSFPNVKYFIGAKNIINDPGVYHVNLRNIITDINTFWTEFVKLCNYIEHPISPDVEQAVKNLYEQWITTTLPEDKFKEFKEQIGLNISFDSPVAQR